MRAVIISLIIGVLLLGGLIALQVFLSKRESRWTGLVLPAIAFVLSLLYPLNMAAPIDGVNAGFVFQLLAMWLLANIPTLVFLAIYFACREKQRRDKQLEKMNIQDLS